MLKLIEDKNTITNCHPEQAFAQRDLGARATASRCLRGKQPHVRRASLDNEPILYRATVMALVFLCSLTLSACTVSVKDHENGENSKVDIETPIGGIHVNEQADVHETGLAVYPGARQKPKTDGESKSANVNISSGLFGVKVVAIEYESDDPPGKVLDFYRNR